MIKRLLVANRGEIAVRIMATASVLGIETVAVYPADDAACGHVGRADAAVELPGADAAAYLDVDAIIAAATGAGCDMVHPGYGFLSERPELAARCAAAGLRFAGPGAEALALFGDKAAARARAWELGVPVLAGTGADPSPEQVLALLREHGAVMIKAVAGGGGRGMRAAHNESSLVTGFHSARMEAEKAFGNPNVYIEKLILNPHHIEFQIVADSHGRVIHLGERDCSIQRRNQKVIEECPSPIMTSGLRKKMGNAAVKLAKSVDYENTGTIEFLVDDNGHFYFMEMNTRLQVEHTITEEVYGCDLVKEQIRIAAGERLSPHVEHAQARLHAVECRINAEDPENNFQSSPGRINFYYAPGGRGVRIDSHAYTGYVVPPYYDSLIAKIITAGATRASAINRMRRALDEYYVTGIKTTVPFHAAIMRSGEFRDGKYDTGFVERMMSSEKFHLVRPTAKLHE